MRPFLFGCIVLLAALFPIIDAAAGEPQAFEQGSFDAILKRYEGTPLIVNFWSLTCPPCLAEMPFWRKALAAHPGLTLVMVSTDTPDEGIRLQRTLTENDLSHIDSWVFTDPFVERLRYEIDPKWRGELPRAYFFDGRGNRSVRSGVVNSDHVKAWMSKGGRS